MEDLTCPKCNCDATPEELKESGLLCPTCGFDMSDPAEPDDFADDEAGGDEKEDEEADEEEEEEE